MHRWLSILCVTVGAFALGACGGSGNPFGGGGSGNAFSGTGGVGGIPPLACSDVQSPPEGCGEPCNSDSGCSLGSYCDGTCTLQCTSEPEEACPGTFECDVRGRCIPTFSGTGGTGNIGGSACQSIQVTPTRSIPNVMFLVDQSGSMTSGFGMNQDRWEGARSAITSVVGDKEEIVRFGLTTYTSDDGNDPCPLLPVAGDPEAARPRVDFGLNNAAAISNTTTYPTSYPSDAGDETPTGDSIDLLVSVIQGNPPPADGPTIIVLATDGEPDSCEQPNPNPTDQARQEAVDAAAAAHAAGIDVFVLWVGDLDDNPADPTRSHMQDVANAGVDGTGTVWVGDEPASLSAAFDAIISDSISCDITIDKPFNEEELDAACQGGDVRLNGNPLSCPGGDWRIKPGANNIIELLGGSCTEFKSGAATLSATFPCGTIIVE